MSYACFDRKMTSFDILKTKLGIFSFIFTEKNIFPKTNYHKRTLVHNQHQEKYFSQM